MSYDLLTDDANTVYAVNCRVENSTIVCGALYLEPLIRTQAIRLAYGTANVEIELPLELVNQTIPFCAWQIELPITNEQVR